MQNITAILKEFGFEVPADKQADLDKKIAENYITKAEHEKKISRAERDRDNWKEQAETAQETLKGFEGVDLQTIQTDLASWKKKAEDAEKDYAAKLAERDFNDALNVELEGIKFTSEAAKKSVVAEIREAGLKVHNGKIMGLNDLIASIKEKDGSAFVNEQQQQLENNKARFTQQHKNPGEGNSMTKADIMAIKDRAERRAAIAANMNLFEKGD